MDGELKGVQRAKFYRALIEKVNNVCGIYPVQDNPQHKCFLKNQISTSKFKTCPRREAESTKFQNEDEVADEKYALRGHHFCKCKRKNAPCEKHPYETVENYLKSTLIAEFRNLQNSPCPRKSRDRDPKYKICSWKIDQDVQHAVQNSTSSPKNVESKYTLSYNYTRKDTICGKSEFDSRTDAKKSEENDQKNPCGPEIRTCRSDSESKFVTVSRRLQPNCEINISSYEDAESVCRARKPRRLLTEDGTRKACRGLGHGSRRSRRRMVRSIFSKFWLRPWAEKLIFESKISGRLSESIKVLWKIAHQNLIHDWRFQTPCLLKAVSAVLFSLHFKGKCNFNLRAG